MTCACGCGELTTVYRGTPRTWVAGHNRTGLVSNPNGASNPTHGLHGSPAYRSWQNMRTRCLNPNGSDWPLYGGRGIAICAEWDDPVQFVADMGERPEGMSLDRIDPDGDYEPDNCRWADARTQRCNQRRMAAAA